MRHAQRVVSGIVVGVLPAVLLAPAVAASAQSEDRSTPRVRVLHTFTDGLAATDEVATAGKAVFYLRGVPSEQTELWRATATGARLVHRFARDEVVADLTSYDASRVAFTVTGSSGYLVDVSDGTGISTLASNLDGSDLTVLGGQIYYAGLPTDPNVVPRGEIWRVAPGAAAEQVTHINTTPDLGPDSWQQEPYSTQAQTLGAVDGHLLFLADPDTWTGVYDADQNYWLWTEDPGPGLQLFSYDPTGGAVMLTHPGCSVGTPCAGDHPDLGVHLAGKVAYGEEDGRTFVTGGTPASTHLLPDVPVLADGPIGDTVVGTSEYFRPTARSGKGLGLWVLTPAGAHRIEKLPHGEGEVLLGGLHGRLLFIHSRHGGNGVDSVWSTDPAGHIKRVADLSPVAYLDFSYTRAATLRGRLYFTTLPFHQPPRSRVWSTDGTARGTRVDAAYPGTQAFAADVGLPVTASTKAVFYTVDKGRTSTLYGLTP